MRVENTLPTARVLILWEVIGLLRYYRVHKVSDRPLTVGSMYLLGGCNGFCFMDPVKHTKCMVLDHDNRPRSSTLAGCRISFKP